MRVAVTGASGHLGAHVVRALLARGDEVRALVHGHDHGIRGLDVERVPGDVLDAASLRTLVEGADLVLHLAAWISLDGDHGGRVTRTNVDGPRNVARAAAEAGCRRMVHVSSVHAIDLMAEPHGHFDETSPRTLGARRDVYDRSKALGELAVLEEAERTGLDVVIVRPTGCMGPLDFGPSIFGGTLLGMLRGSFPAIVDGGFDWIDMRDVATGVLAAAARGRRGEVYLLGGERRSLAELAAMACEVTGRRPPPVVPYGVVYAVAPFGELWGHVTGRSSPFTRASLHALESYPYISWEKARAELGHAPRPIRDTVIDTASWFVAHGWLDARRVAIELPEPAK